MRDLCILNITEKNEPQLRRQVASFQSSLYGSPSRSSSVIGKACPYRDSTLLLSLLYLSLKSESSAVKGPSSFIHQKVWINRLYRSYYSRNLVLLIEKGL